MVRAAGVAMTWFEQSPASLVRRFHGLRDILSAHDALWRPPPFHQLRPAWCEVHPDLSGFLLALEDGEAEMLAADHRALIDLAGRYIPELLGLHDLIDLPVLDARLPPGSAHHIRHVPGRKQGQIEAFAGSVGEVAAPLLEWCSGKGHLGRLLGGHWRKPVLSLEWDAELCSAGEHLAAKAGVAQTFLRADVLDEDAEWHLDGRHAVALHACGDLHMALLRGAVARSVPAIDLAPCCYYRIAGTDYVPLNPDAGLSLSRNELHLAVTETATAGARERRQHDRAMAWKLAFLELCADEGIPRGRTFKSIPASWYALGFDAWVERLATREGIALPKRVDWPAAEAKGWSRRREVMRRELARMVFRRPLEVWLALDRALFLARRGYRVRLAEFCGRAVTPRNLLISARL
jgi:hypothetical protein